MGGPGGCERRIEVLMKIQKKKKRRKLGVGFVGSGMGGVGSGGGRGGGQVEWIRMDVNQEFKFLGKLTKKSGRGVSWGVGGGGQGGCERRIEVFVEIKKKKKLGGGRCRGGVGSGVGGRVRGGGGGGRVDVNEELKFL